MAEVLVFSEGSAYMWTGAATASSLLTFVRANTIALTTNYAHFKPPHATRYTDYPIASGVTLTLTQARSQLAAMKNFAAATGGGNHFHIFESVGNITQSAGIFLYSGNINSVNIVGQSESEVTLALNAVFPSWSAY